MTKDEMLERLDGMMMTCLNDAFQCHDNDNPKQFEWAQMEAVGVLLSAFSLDVIKPAELATISGILCNMTGRIG